MSKLTVGDKAPKFNLKDKDGEEHGVGLDKSDYLVLFFYPKDNTPGCTLEAQGFSASLKDFSRRNAKVIGISGGDSKTKDKFCAKYDLKVALVSDSDSLSLDADADADGGMSGRADDSGGGGSIGMGAFGSGR